MTTLQSACIMSKTMFDLFECSYLEWHFFCQWKTRTATVAIIKNNVLFSNQTVID